MDSLSSRSPEPSLRSATENVQTQLTGNRQLLAAKPLDSEVKRSSDRLGGVENGLRRTAMSVVPSLQPITKEYESILT